MNVNLYSPSTIIDDNSNLVTFTMLDTINSIKIFVYSVGVVDDASASTLQTRLVSGYERGGSRDINMRVECASTTTTTTTDKHAYLISCIRAPYVLARLIAHKGFTRNVAPVLVRFGDETQVWHVFGVRKGKESASIKRVRGVTVCENGIESYIAKELIVLRGNVPAGFVAALSKNAPHVQDVHVAKCVFTSLLVNNEDVIVDAAK
ncbi:hypothetical protein [Alphabaculovirus myunipunctae]|uniref:EP23 n=1 Tax=Mythimna unipuncta nucleopolyhedrovirus TaxID=447897 RepID=A0A2K9VSG0_9ABAC|nr:hypothetical protein [Mythimna unipuncta nucleopolyhedrovirus]AUV65409.1 hypothetical protein [Mythimna unipuncta nucleopolyhedrovirus]